MTPEELKQRLDRGENLFVLDVREPHEYQICNLGGHLIPLNDLPQARRANSTPRARSLSTASWAAAAPRPSISSTVRLQQGTQPGGRDQRLGRTCRSQDAEILRHQRVACCAGPSSTKIRQKLHTKRKGGAEAPPSTIDLPTNLANCHYCFFSSGFFSSGFCC